MIRRCIWIAATSFALVVGVACDATGPGGDEFDTGADVGGDAVDSGTSSDGTDTSEEAGDAAGGADSAGARDVGGGDAAHRPGDTDGGSHTGSDTGDTSVSGDGQGGDDDTDAAGADITSLQIDPDTVSRIDTGMTDEYFDVVIEVTGFQSPIADVELVIAENDRRAPNNPGRETVVNGTTIEVNNIQKTWFQGMDPGTYHIGATVTADSGTTVTRRKLAQVEVTREK